MMLLLAVTVIVTLIAGVWMIHKETNYKSVMRVSLLHDVCAVALAFAVIGGRFW